jgi:hypothetical protein
MSSNEKALAIAAASWASSAGKVGIEAPAAPIGTTNPVVSETAESKNCGPLSRSRSIHVTPSADHR